jgi:hypothetical protein
MKNFFNAPILLTTIIGIVLFILYSQVANYYEKKNRQIIVSESQIGLLKEAFTQTWNRPPTQDELQGLINNHIKDEVYYKEAVALGLDKTDPAVKRRLRQLMELILDDNAQVYPSEDQLLEYMNENSDRFKSDALISFRHVYFKPAENEIAEETLDGLQNGTIMDLEAGSMIMIPGEFENETSSVIESTFGKDFAHDVYQLEVSSWQGPIRSAYGWHLVLITSMTESELPDLNDIWDKVEREWTFERKEAIMEEQYQKIQDQYLITIETYQ